MKSLLTKNSQFDCVFQLMLGLEEHYSLSPFGDLNRLFWRPNWSIIQILTSKIIYYFNAINLAPKCTFVSFHWFVGKCKVNAVFTSQSKSKQTWFPWCLMPIGTIQHLNTQCTILTNSSVLAASVVYGEWRWQKMTTTTRLVEFSYLS